MQSPFLQLQRDVVSFGGNCQLALKHRHLNGQRKKPQ